MFPPKIRQNNRKGKIKLHQNHVLKTKDLQTSKELSKKRKTPSPFMVSLMVLSHPTLPQGFIKADQ